MNKKWTLVAATVLVSTSQAQVAYNSFQPGYQWDQSVGYGINGTGAPPKFIQSFAVGFEAASGGPVDQISVAVGFLGLGSGRTVRLELYGDDGTQQGMGALLGTWEFQNTINHNLGALYQIDNVGPASVALGSWYWLHMIAVEPDGFHTWMYGDLSVLCPALVSHDGGSTFEYSPVNNAPALEVTVVPEPGTFAVLGLSLAALCLRRK